MNTPEEGSFEDPKPRRKRGPRKSKTEVKRLDENLELRTVRPKNSHQQQVFDDYESGSNLFLHGTAGTGKTYVACYLGLRSVLDRNSRQKRLVIVRSAVPTRDIGFIPGSVSEKLAVYEAPYQAIFNDLFGRDDAYHLMKLKRQVQFLPTSFVRGTTIEDAVILVDESQNNTFHENDSVITRVGDGSRIVFCGDYRQSDLTREVERNGIRDFTRIIEKMKSFRTVEFDEDDIVRGKMVKEYLVTKNKLGLS